MYLYLDTTERDSFQIALVDKGQVLKHKTVLSVRQHSEKLLKAINKLLVPSPLQGEGRVRVRGARGLRGIAVVKGPGSFTSLRVGIATANALAFALGIPVAGVNTKYSLNKIETLLKKKRPKIVLPKYGSAPHITLSKR